MKLIFVKSTDIPDCEIRQSLARQCGKTTEFRSRMNEAWRKHIRSADCAKSLIGDLTRRYCNVGSPDQARRDELGKSAAGNVEPDDKPGRRQTRAQHLVELWDIPGMDVNDFRSGNLGQGGFHPGCILDVECDAAQLCAFPRPRWRQRQDPNADASERLTHCEGNHGAGRTASRQTMNDVQYLDRIACRPDHARPARI